MNRLYRTTVCGVTLLSLIGLSGQLEAASAHSSDRVQTLVVLEAPVGIAPSIYYTQGLEVRHDNLGRTRAVGNVRLSFQHENGGDSSVWLWLPQSQVLISPAAGQHVRYIRVLAEPLSDAGVELEVPTGVKVGLEGAGFFSGTADRTLRVAGPAILRLSNGVRLLVLNTRLTLIERQPAGDRWIIIESFSPRQSGPPPGDGGQEADRCHIPLISGGDGDARPSRDGKGARRWRVSPE
jgi:hypothetical protein